MGAQSIKDRIAAKRGAIAANKSKGIRPYKFRAGKTKFRILPGLNGTDFDRRFGKTWLKSFDGQQKFSIGDRDITFGQTDAIREMIFAAMRQAPDEDIKKHYTEMLASPRNIFGALILDDPNQPADQPVIVEVSETQFDNILAQFEVYTDMDPNYDLASVDNGHIFTCEKSGSGFDTKYVFLATPQKAPIRQDIADKAIDLDAWIEGEFEGLEQKAIEFLGRLNGAVGISVPVPAGLIGSSAQPAAAALPPAQTAPAQTVQTPVAPDPAAQTAQNVSAAAVTTALEPEDATYEPVAETPAATVEPAATATVETPAAAAPAQSDEIDAILAELA